MQDPAVARSFLSSLNERSIPIRSNARTRHDDEPTIDLDPLDAGRQPGPAQTAHTERDALDDTTEAPYDRDPDEVEDLEPPSSIPELEVPDD